MIEMPGPLMGAVPPERRHRVTGEVVYINAGHRFYRARYETPGMSAQYECFPIPVPPEPEEHHGHYRGPSMPKCPPAEREKALAEDRPRRPRGRPRKSEGIEEDRPRRPRGRPRKSEAPVY